MKNMILRCLALSAFLLLIVSVQAQSYDELWRKAEDFQKKDLPQSVISVADQLMKKAASEKNVPQLMKAFLFRAEWKTALSPDSADVEFSRLKVWEAEEKDVVAKSVLASLCGTYSLQVSSPDVKSALRYFKASLEEKDRLLRVKTGSYTPMTEEGKWSRLFAKDNMYDLLVHQAIRSLLADVDTRQDKAVRAEVLTLFDELIAVYTPHNRSAALLTQLEKLPYQLNTLSLDSYYPEHKDSAVYYLNRWIEEYEGSPACAEAYRRLAGCYATDEPARQLAVAEEGLRRYPDTPFSDGLKKQIERVKAPELSVDFDCYPGDSAQMRLIHKNVAGFTCNLYSLKGDAKEFWHLRTTEKELLKKRGKKVLSRHFMLTVPADYRQKDTVLNMLMPQAGTYLVELQPDGHKEAAAYRVLYLSALRGVGFVHPDEEIIIVDRKTGHPVPAAQMEVYRREADGFKLLKTLTAGSEGLLKVKPEELKNTYLRFVAAGDHGMNPIPYHSSWWGTREHEPRTLVRTVLYTDRSVYRPGQTVRLAGRIYRQATDKVSVAPGEERELELRDANGRPVSKQTIRTDDFGTFSADFSLPEEVLSGTFRVTTADGNCSFRVEEYKLPTFRVDFQPYSHSYLPGDTVSLTAEAMGFNGVPLRLCEVNYRVVRSTGLWNRMSREGEIIASGKTETDANGKFTVSAPLVKYPERADLWRSYYTYKVIADVTGENGETQTGMLCLPVGETSLTVHIMGLTSRVVREKQEKIQFIVQNLNNETVKVPVAYSIYTVDENGKPIEKVLSETTASTEAFLPSGLLRLPSGAYRLEAVVTDEQGRECKSHEEFVLFSLQDRKPPVRTEDWFYQDGSEWKDGTVPAVYIGSSERQVHCFYRVVAGGKVIESKTVYLDDEILKLEYPYRDAYGKGISISYTFVRNGNVHGRTVTLTQPEPDKRLSLKWESFRNHLQPGGKEEWRLLVTSPDGHKADASLLATLYDASLDQLYPHEWRFRLFFDRYVARNYFVDYSPYPYMSLYCRFPRLQDYQGVSAWSDMYTRLYVPSLFTGNRWYGGGIMARANTMMKAAATDAPLAESKVLDSVEESGTVTEVVFEEEVIADAPGNPENALQASGRPSVRSNFAETAFFYPALRTDSNGVAVLSFTVPESLTEWKLMVMAHTKDMDYGLLTDKAVTQKELMIRPNLPRFVRKGDQTVLAAVVQNLSMSQLEGKAVLELADARSGKTVLRKRADFSVAGGANQAVDFAFEVPEAYDLLVCKVTAVTETLSDGEQHYLPVLSDREWVTETVPLQVEAGRTGQVDVRRLFNSGNGSAGHKRLTVELTAQPEWYALQALPVLGEPTYDDAVSWGTAFYANALARKVMNDYPQLKQILESWKLDAVAQQSPLEKNEELKALLLQETPWVNDAAHESERRRQLALLADDNTMQYRQQRALKKLRELQLADGSWGWYSGMSGNRYITSQLAVLMARMQAMGISMAAQGAGDIYRKALTYLKEEVRRDYERLLERKEKGEKNLKLWNEPILDYMYMASLDQTAMSLLDQSLKDELVKALAAQPAACSIREKAVIARVLHAFGLKDEAELWLQSVKEYMVSAPGMGSYFDTPKARYSWRSYRIPTHVAAMEAIRAIHPDTALLDQMKRWLLKQKQVQCWETPVATADAVFAFIGTGTAASSKKATLHMTWGKERLTASTEGNAGATGYVKQVYEVKKTPAAVLKVENRGETMGWGAVYAQYTEASRKLQAYQTEGLSISRELLAADGTEATGWKVGDRLTVRLTIRADRDMDFVQVTDRRAACMEPKGALSGYEWQKGTGYYRVHRDASTQFFIDKLTKGVHVIEYQVYADRAGTYQYGTAVVQSAYSPEFSARTEGAVISVK